MCNVTESTYERIKQLCQKKGITVSRLAIELGLSKSTFSWIKNYPERRISAGVAQKIADYFGTTVDYILTGVKIDNSAKVTEDDLKIALFDGDKEVTDEMWQEVKSFAEMVAIKHKYLKEKNDES
ncbi:MAG: helix-turn-helix transcriptional regulator [Ruminococcaceae bacterium]|nr:helix-turn-helix transcriptional regulator [Oscillospiraceae bacterium]